jgi:hypothetical protein
MGTPCDVYPQEKQFLDLWAISFTESEFCPLYNAEVVTLGSEVVHTEKCIEQASRLGVILQRSFQRCQMLHHASRKRKVEGL